MTDLNLVASLLDAGLTGQPVVVVAAGGASGNGAAATPAVVSAPTQVSVR
jgi:hypothetical protein